MLLELAIGDAYGAGFEYVDADFIAQHHHLTHYVRHPRHQIIPGYYTDDTQMTLALAELIVSGAEFSRENLAAKFVEVFKRDPREGYAQGFYDFLTQIKSGEEFLVQIQPDSDKSGAAMRACPVGIYPTIAEVLDKSALQAAITYNTPDGIRAARAAALMTHYFLYDLGVKADLGHFLEKHVPGDWNTAYRGKVKAKGWMSVQAAITAVMRNDSLTGLLRDCINFSGDVDTVTTIALGAASCSREISQDLPEALITQLENGTYGYDYLIAFDQQLLSLKK